MLPSTPGDLTRMMGQLGISPSELERIQQNPQAIQTLISRLMGSVPSGSSSAVAPSVRDPFDVNRMMDEFQRAKTTFESEKAKPPAPFSQTPSLLANFNYTRDEAEKDESDEAAFPIRSTYMGADIHVSRTPLEMLSRVSLGSMQVRKVHEGNYLLCRIVALPYRVFATQFVIEDTAGVVCHVSLYNYPGTVGASRKPLEALFPIGTILAFREPYLKTTALGQGNAMLRVDCPSDVILLEPNHPRLTGVKWKTGDRVLYTPRVPRTEDEWKSLGNNHFKSGHYLPAAVAYSRGLRYHSASYLLRLNRSMAYLRLQYNSAALADCTTILERNDIESSIRCKALYRAAQAHYGMANWDTASNAFIAMAEEYPAEATECNQWVAKCQCRKMEASSAAYDWVKMYDTIKLKERRIDVADYIGSVEMVAMPSRGGGRGAVASADINAGDVVVVSKAFVSAFAEDFTKPEVFMAHNFLTNRVDMGYGAILPTKIAERLAGDPGCAQGVYDLYAGPTQSPAPPQYRIPSPQSLAVEHPLEYQVDVDIPRLEGILSYNSFKPKHLKPGRYDYAEKSSEQNDPSALFLFPSLFNHSCAPNTHWYCFGDIMVIRATCDISKGDELFLAYGGGQATYLSRQKDTGLEKFLGSCHCSLCNADRLDGDEACRRRDDLDDKLDTWTTPVAINAGIKRLRSTYKQSPAGDCAPLFRAYAKLALTYSRKGEHITGIQALMQALECLGVIINDRSDRAFEEH